MRPTRPSLSKTRSNKATATGSVPPLHFSEIQFADWRIFALLLIALSALLIWRRGPRWPVLVAMVLLIAGFFECRLETSVDDSAVRVRFGWVPVYSRTIERRAIAAVAPVTAPSATASAVTTDAWGWGAHWERDGTLAMTIRGSQGVIVTLRDGSRIRIGSQEPGALARALAPA
ncbi:Bacterial Pleckstrin homology domain-containing protein [Pararobbsia alpina]